MTHVKDELSHTAVLESILFVASGPVSTARLGTVLDMSPATVRSLLFDLEQDYLNRGLRLQWIGQKCPIDNRS